MPSEKSLTINDLCRLLEGETVAAVETNRCVGDFAASDLLSDILACRKEEFGLVTGLNTAQAVRTADITGAACIVLCRGKAPSGEMVALAERLSIPIVTTPLSMFDVCGLIHAATGETAE